jgi:hypothetical protein
LCAAAALRRIGHAVRLALPLLAVLAALSLVACAGDDEEAATPVPAAQRFVTADDAPESKPDPVETRQTTEDFDEFIALLSERSVDPDPDELTAVFEDAGFQGLGQDARFFGDTHSPDNPHIFSSAIELESEDGAASALDWLETDALKPCPMTCAVEWTEFDVDDVSGGRGVHRIATAEAVERLGAEDQVPFESYWVGFTVGPVVYTMELRGPPGSVSEEQAQEIASAYHERLSDG